MLRDRQFLGLKFRRQVPLYGFVADFLCTELQLVIELDGTVHESAGQQARDREREAALAGYGFTIVRFTNEQLERSPQAVLESLATTVEGLHRERPTRKPNP